MAASENSVNKRFYINYNTFYLNKIRLYETASNYYMVGCDIDRVYWRVMKIDRTEFSELNIVEDPTIYSESQCVGILRRIDEGNKPVGGLKLVTICYGIIGFIRFLGPYYMLIITERRELGKICGHTIYGVSKSKMISIPNRSDSVNSRDENRYKKLLCQIDLTKDFYFSYTYHIMRSFQKNVEDYRNGQCLHETMFVWNEYLTRGIRDRLKNSNLWIVGLVYGFFKQVDLSVFGKDFKFTLVARRSRHYAGTRYLKRGVNDNGRVANDVETEQIVVDNAYPKEICSVVQNRGSIPLFWSQDTSRSVAKPDIVLTRKDHSYEATRLHFQDLVERYGDPIIVLNLIKRFEKKPREAILRSEFANAVRFINRDFEKAKQIRFFQWDLHEHSRTKGTSVLIQLANMAAYSMKLTGIFHSEVADENNRYVDIETAKPFAVQRGVLRTNCIDCLDRTNVAQYIFGLVSLGTQLHALKLIQTPKIQLENPLADELMKLYETMGDTLSLQYSGSAAHNSIFSEKRGQWKPATESKKFIRNLQRYYNNAYFDYGKQDSIDVFLGHFQAQPVKRSLSKSRSDQHVMSRDSNFSKEDVVLDIKRSQSDTIIPSKSEEQRLKECAHIISDDDEECNFSDFVDSDWLSSPGNSSEEKRIEACKVANEMTVFSERFVNWVVSEC